MGNWTESPATVWAQDIFETSATQRHPIGMVRPLSDKRVFVYGKAGSAIGRGLVCQSAALVTNHVNMAVATTAVGADSVTVTLGATAVAEDYYADGFLSVNSTGAIYKIKSHPAANASSTCVISLYDKLHTALTNGTDTVSLVVAPTRGFISVGGSVNNAVVGVTATSFAAGEFGWLQVAGPAAVKAGGTLVAGSTAHVGANGTVVPQQSTLPLSQLVGNVLYVAANGSYAVVDLKLR